MVGSDVFPTKIVPFFEGHVRFRGCNLPMVGSDEGHFPFGETANGLFFLAKLAVSFRVGPATWEWKTSFIQSDFQLPLKFCTTIWPNVPKKNVNLNVSGLFGGHFPYQTTIWGDLV